MSNRILAVDDSTSMRQMVTFTLSSAGFDVTEAEDGVVALSLARKQKFDLVLADVNMPNMDGLTLVRELRGLSEYKFTPLLMLTTESTPEKKLEGKAAGATGWMVKPFVPEQLISTIKRVIG
ncbi:two-component system, chemotaxis family, response regulator CheY [Hydrocarboniphaga daqingensis]|uniref:Two-component system, chemotaxis family, response regulator CheY n=1 Tax=Hydrocarboniphaga daqingensis TaxID=490188 RepID=A0A1M5K6F0_9GAMM|nr:response regulator [Hydrocarboniphaga daqingensis]SHG48366.1 two-component system, chemotaxis family, response regulator CheY [Hydrocarboniphaga daqingensis]